MSRPPVSPNTLQHRQDHDQSEKTSSWAGIIKEFYVDLLGSFVPGLLFTLTAVLPSWWATSMAWRAINRSPVGAAASMDWQLVGQLKEHFRIELWCLLFVLAYVLGCLFYRRDPKKPDQRSCTYVLWLDRADIKRCVVQPCGAPAIEKFEELTKAVAGGIEGWRKHQLLRLMPCPHKHWWATSNGRELHDLIERTVAGEGGQFPYSHLHEYLNGRGLTELAVIVKWQGTDGETHSRRTKMFINLLKVRLQYHAPAKCGEVLRNEAHIRMMSSVWYAAVTLQRLCVYCIAPVPAILLFREIKAHGFHLSAPAVEPVSLLIFAIALALAAEWLKLTIRRFFHYQRVREIVYVLETAYWAKNETCPSILEKLG